MVRRFVSLALALLAAAALGACGATDQSTSSTATTATMPAAAVSTPVEVAALGATVSVSPAGEPGLVVESVRDETKARLRVGDVILSFNGGPVGSPQELIKKLGNPAIGDRFTIEVMRGSQRFTLTEVASPTAYLGAEIKDGDGGVRVVSVPPGGPAQDAKIEPGDLITALDHVRTPTSEDLLQAIATHAPGDRVTIAVSRGPNTLELEATLAEHP